MNASERVQLAQRFYGALAAGDVAVILATLERDLRAEITVGLPEGWGGVYASARELLEQCWRPMFDKVEVRPMPREYFACAQDSVVVHGEYRIRSRATGDRRTAAFVHLLEFADGRIARLLQVTDSARWHEVVGADLKLGGS
jgi:ketosteroid isomerase-like protein